MSSRVPDGSSRKPTSLRPHGRLAALAAIAITALTTLAVSAQVVEPPPVPQGLKGVSVPTPSQLSNYVFDRSAAVRLGKALFWDMQVGSDGKQACASCHFQAGADPRSRNQISPGLNRMASPSTANPDNSFQVGGPNYQLKLDDYPFHKFADPRSRFSAVLRTSNDVTSSQGVTNERYVGLSSSPSEDVRSVSYDDIFHVGSSNTRRVEPRNTPTVINAVFNFRNFWDGRAQYLFNGVNPFGGRDSSARVYKNNGLGAMTPVQVLLDNASLASQASGPPTSNFEMSADGRNFMQLGRRLLTARPLALQKIDPTDSVLGGWIARDTLGRPTTGLADFPGSITANYAAMVKAAFLPAWWNTTQLVRLNADGTRTIIPAATSRAANEFTQMEANFSLLFALAIQLYESTLVSDDSPFDRSMIGDVLAMTSAQKAGQSVFFGKGKCASCHGGPEFTNASVSMTKKEPLQRMVMGNGGVAVYDEGFYNTSANKTLEDIINGGKDPSGRPISLTGLAQAVGSAQFSQMIGISPNITVNPGERIAVNGAAKTPTLRNVELTAPYFHNGSVATLRQVVEFYNRGGNFHENNIADIDPDIQNLGLTEEEITNLVDFLHALTDPRVRFHQAPFDHPQLFVANGHVGDTGAVSADSSGRALDSVIEVPAVGYSGYYYNRAATPSNFLNTALSAQPTVSLVAKSSGLCVQSGALDLVAPATFGGCTGSSSQLFKVRWAESGQGTLVSVARGTKLAPFALLPIDGTDIVTYSAEAVLGIQPEWWHIVDAGNGYYRITNHNNSLCMDASAATLKQRRCNSSLPATQLFTLQGS